MCGTHFHMAHMHVEAGKNCAVKKYLANLHVHVPVEPGGNEWPPSALEGNQEGRITKEQNSSQ